MPQNNPFTNAGFSIKDARAQTLPRTDFLETFTAGRKMVRLD